MLFRKVITFTIMLCWGKLKQAREQAKKTAGCIVTRHRIDNNSEWYEFACCTYQQLLQEIARDQNLFEYVGDDVNPRVKLYLALKWSVTDFGVPADETLKEAIDNFSTVLHQIGVQLSVGDVQVFKCGGSDTSSRYKYHVVFGKYCCPRKKLKDLVEVAFPASDPKCDTFSYQPKTFIKANHTINHAGGGAQTRVAESLSLIIAFISTACTFNSLGRAMMATSRLWRHPQVNWIPTRPKLPSLQTYMGARK